MFETKGKVTSITSFSETEDQLTIQMVVPEPLGEEGETYSHDWVVPKGRAKVGDIVSIQIKGA